jgi:NAD(P)-dependent dehydrogenase (short-subunit alcohol dehydrogenase family)
MSAEDKRALVIGGETPLGRAIAVGLAEAGADVAIASLTPDKQAEFAINSALNELWAIGRKGVALPIDASDAAQVTDAVAKAEAELGALDCIVAMIEDAAPLRVTLADRIVLSVSPEADPAAALAQVLDALS